MRRACIWSNRFDEPVQDVEIEMLNRWGSRVERKVVHICPWHEPAVRRFAELETGWGRLDMPLFLLLMVLMIAGVFAESVALVAGSVVALGVLMLVFPFATPATVAMIGLEASIRTTRYGGLVMIALGAAMIMMLP